MSSSSRLRYRRIPRVGGVVLLVTLLASMLAAVLVAGPAGAEGAGSATRRVAAASVDAGGSHTCVVVSTGALRCWGDDASGQLGHDSAVNIGDGSVSIKMAGDIPLGGKAIAVAAGTSHTCAVLTTGAVRCWGAGASGRLGYNDTSNVSDPSGPSIHEAGDVPLGIGAKASSITTGDRFTCALLTTGAVRCWGEGLQGELGHDSVASIGDDPARSIEVAGDVPLGGRATAVTAGDSFTCALLTTGSVRCWGYGPNGELGHNDTRNIGDGDPAGQSIEQAGDIPLTGKVTAIAAGNHHTCALMTTGGVKCWGAGSLGQLGYGSKANIGDGLGVLMQNLADVPLGGKALAITAGGNHTCALLTTGAVRCWGEGNFGELGHGNATSVGDGSGPSIEAAGDVPLGWKAVAVALSAGAGHTCALLATGALRCWGEGFTGRLGYGNPENVGDGFGPSIKQAGDVPIGPLVRVRAATTLTAQVTPSRDRHAPYVYSVSGRLRGGFAVDTATCTGRVKISVRLGRHTLQTRTPRVGSRCQYHATIRIGTRKLPVRRATRLTLRLHYRGNGNLLPARATRHLTAH
jgi:hypothetical protein